MITDITRRLSHKQAPFNRQQDILRVLEGREMTARQIANNLGYYD